ncbi:MAG: glycoside hydrolase family 2 protein [Bacteroidales bacterium]
MNDFTNFNSSKMKTVQALVFIILLCVSCQKNDTEKRTTISLDGNWDIAKGIIDIKPDSYKHKTTVPGLLDKLPTDFERPAPKEKGSIREQGMLLRHGAKNMSDDAYWYRTSFQVPDGNLDILQLNIQKAKYGSSIYLNGQRIKNHSYNFTRNLINITDYIRKDTANILEICIGAERYNKLSSTVSGSDFEKRRYISGIYDHVSITSASAPFVANVQVAPKIGDSSIDIETELFNPTAISITGNVVFRVKEKSTGKTVVEEKVTLSTIKEGETVKRRDKVVIPDAHLWSPETPFLYTLEVETKGDLFTTVFGMREFHFDTQSKKPILNGKPYYLRGTNICMYRFFEDPDRGNKPWDKEWARKVIRSFKSMGWNSCRYCIGFPPEIWYEVADEEGMLIQDEFPIWISHFLPESWTFEELYPQFEDWMQERWNHPCVIIWDAQNESVIGELMTDVIDSVRQLDMSDRPWDNGWDIGRRKTDPFEAHPYLFYNPVSAPQASDFRMNKLSQVNPEPGTIRGESGGSRITNTQNQPIIINEYDWLWLNRDGSSCSLSKKNYDAMLGKDATPNQRRELYARYTAMFTEFYRAGRKVAGIQHFCGLGYSNPPDGETSDHFIDLENVVMEPYYVKYVGNSFAPLGIMINFFEPKFKVDEEIEVPVKLINDTDANWKGSIKLSLHNKDGEEIKSEIIGASVSKLDTSKFSIGFKLPTQQGEYEFIATIDDKDVSSYRKISVNP